jgi:drug/metabolite transporter superfamily protein YnfA
VYSSAGRYYTTFEGIYEMREMKEMRMVARKHDDWYDDIGSTFQRQLRP